MLPAGRTGQPVLGLVAQGVAGAFVRDGRFATFAMAANQRPAGPAGGGATFDVYSREFGAVLKRVTETFVDGVGRDWAT